MGRTKNVSILSANCEKSNADESHNIDLLQNDEDNEDEGIFQEQSRYTEHETTKNARRQIIINSMPVKKSESEEGVKEVKRSRGRPRKNLADVVTQSHIQNNAAKKSYTENNEDLLKFENDVYENEDIFNVQLENSSADLIELPNVEIVKQEANNTHFETEAKASNESIITISLEENSNSNPVVKTFHCAPNLERNLSSPDVLHVQFNPSSTKTYKNKRKFVNATLDSSIAKNKSLEQNKIDESLQNDKIDRCKAHISKPSPSFEINPNFVRNTRKKVLKYDVCDLLNKKSHKKIQIEARIDSMPAKSKLNASKTSCTNPNVNTAKNESALTKVIPKINDLPSIIRKYPTSETFDLPSKDISGNVFSMIIEKPSPPKSLIQIQGKIVADNRPNITKTKSSQNLFDDSKVLIPYTLERQNLEATGQYELQNAPVKRRPGRPKIKKESLNSDSFISVKRTASPKICSHNSNSSAIIEKSKKNDFSKELESDQINSSINNLSLEIVSSHSLKYRSAETISMPSKEIYYDHVNLGKSIKNTETDVPTAFKVCESTSERLIPYEIASSKKFTSPYNSAKFEKAILEEEKIKDKLDPVGSFSEKLSGTTKDETILLSQTNCNINNELSETFQTKNAETTCSLPNQNESNQNENLIDKNIKEVRVLIKNVDKQNKPERCGQLNENHSCSTNLHQETAEIQMSNINIPPLTKTQLENTEESRPNFDQVSGSLTSESSNNNNKAEIINKKVFGEKILLNKSIKNDSQESLNQYRCKSVECPSDLTEKTSPILEVVCSVENEGDTSKLEKEEIKNGNNVKVIDVSDVIIEKPLKNCENEEKTEKIQYLSESRVDNDYQEKFHLQSFTKLEECPNKTSPIILETYTKEKIIAEKNKDNLVSTSQIENKYVSQTTKQKELKTGMDIWLEKVQMESKLKSLADVTKKKSDKILKPKPKEEIKLKLENKTKYDGYVKSDLGKGDPKTKEYVVNKEVNKLCNDFKSKKESKDKYENKIKLVASKLDFKSKEEIKYKESKELTKQEKKKDKDKDESKNKTESKTDTKIKSDFFVQKQVFGADKEDLKQKNDNKCSKNEIYGNLKNETSLRTIDIFNFAAKDELAQKGYIKKKKKSETNTTFQDKMSKSDVPEAKVENEKDLIQKKIVSDKGPKIIKEKQIERSLFNKDGDFDKILEKEIIKKFDIAEDTKTKRQSKNIDEVESNTSERSTSDFCLKKENTSSMEKVIEDESEQELQKEKIDESTVLRISCIKPNYDNFDCDMNLKQNDFLNLKDEVTLSELSEFEFSSKQNTCTEFSGNEKENKLLERSIIKECGTNDSKTETENQNVPQFKPEVSLQEKQETSESTNEILDPLKDIESFLEAAGNLLSRSHSSDDEKESIGRRGIRNRSSDDKIICEQYENKIDTICDIEEKLKSIEGDNENSEFSDVQSKLYINEDENQELSNKNFVEECAVQNGEKAKIKLISDLTSTGIDIESNKNIDCLHSDFNILTPTKALQKEKREEWFSQIDSSIDKDLNDEVSFDSIVNYNESTPLPKKIGAGPRTPPLPPPLSDEELDKNKTRDLNIKEASSFYDQSSLESDIANSIISTSIKIPNSMVASLHELKFMGSPKNPNLILDEQLKLIENQMDKKLKKKSETSQKDRELKKFLKTLKKNELSKDWKKTYKELKKIKKKSAENFAVSKSSLKYSPDNMLASENSVNIIASQKIKKSTDSQDEYNSNNSTIRRSHRLKSIAMQQNQQIAIGRGGLVRNDYEDLIRADLAQVQAQNTKFLKAMENSLNQFKQIKENEYKCERVISKEAKRMMCDCFLTKEEEERGEYGCGEDCLNRLLMIECGPKCNVGDRCTNKRFQRGQYAPCRVFMTEKKGCGIFADVDIPAGEFIMEYVGEVVDSEQFEKRAAEYSACKNKHFYFMSLRSNAIIDATSRGNISRFINHSCDPNAETQKWTVNGELHIGFFTTRTVAPGEEITFDYQFQRYGKQAQRCFCEAVNCRGWIGEEPDSDEEMEEDFELSFKTKEDLEKISRDVQSYADKDKLQILEENKLNVEEHLNEKIIEPGKNKSVLTDEELKIKQEEREQRKKDKQMKREIRLAQKKHDFLEDPDLEDEIYRLSKTGLKNQVQTLRLSRLIVRAKLLQTRINLLEILRAGEIPCRRLFLDYHGLKLLHGWMNESESRDSNPTEDNLKMRFAILETLNCLPIPNKTMLKESKVYQIVQNWTQDKIVTISPIDGSASDSNSGHAIAIKDKSNDTVIDQNTKEIQIEIKDIAVKLINDWEVLPEVFRIPRKERVEQMKEHEREADRRYAALNVADDDRDSKANRDRYKKSRWDSSIKQRWSNKIDSNKDRRKNDQEKLDDGLTKEQRRQAFAAKVAQDEAEKLNAEKRRNLEYEAKREFEYKCKFFLLNCTKTHPRDIPFRVDQKTNTWYTKDNRKIPIPPSHLHIEIPPRLKSTNPSDYKMPKMDLPPGWKFAIDPVRGQVFYYHVKIRRPQWEQPPKIFPLVNPENNTNNSTSGSSTTMNANDNNSSDSSSSDSEVLDETDALTLLRQERAISPRKEEDRVYNQNEMRRYKENKEKIRRRKEEIKRRKVRLLLKTGEQASDDININQLNESDPLPIADYLISSDEDDDTIVEELDSKLIEKIVKGESIVDELDALKIKKPLKRPLPIKEKSNGNGASNSTSNNTTAELKKRLKLEDKKHKNSDEIKKSKPSNKNYRYFARKAKEKFRSDIAGIIVQHLQPYRKDRCQVGKITTNEDFKHLARKLTHFVMIKELKHCDSTGQTLIVTDSVKNKSREFIKKYMAKYGETYVRPESDPEYKEIPL